MQINLNINKRKFAPKFYPKLWDYESRWEAYMGSAGSGKSYFITQKLILKALKEKRRVLVCRRYGSTIRNSVFALFKIVINELQLTPYCKIRETDFHIELPNGSEIIFIGLDDEIKLLSIANISDVFVEEAFEIPKGTLEQLNLRMRGAATNQQIYMAWNPISRRHWLYDFCEVTPPQSFSYMHSTYKDNPFLNKSYTDALEELRITNPARARIYCDGKWGVDAEGLVYNNWAVEDFDYMSLAADAKYQHRVGMDMGFVDASTIVCTLYDKNNKTIYIYKDYYKTGAQLDEIAKAMDERNLRKTLVYCDSADARAIAYFRNQGFRVEASKKGKGSVDTGIAFIQEHKLIVHPSCQHIITELENYSYVKDKQTDSFTNKTTHEYSHTLDALRYAYCDIFKDTKLKSVDIKLLGL